MEMLLLLLVCLVSLSFVIKTSIYGKHIYVFVYGLISALFVGLMYPLAIEQSKTKISDWLSDTNLMLNISILICIDVMIQLAFCLLSVKIYTDEKVKKKTLFLCRVLGFLPNLTIFPTLFGILVFVVFSLPGQSFSLIAWSFAIVIFMTVPLLSFLVGRILSTKEIRFELLFLLNVLIATLGTIATVNGKTAVEGSNYMDFKSLAFFVLLVMIGACTGFFIYRMKIKNIFNSKTY